MVRQCALDIGEVAVHIAAKLGLSISEFDDRSYVVLVPPPLFCLFQNLFGAKAAVQKKFDIFPNLVGSSKIEVREH